MNGAATSNGYPQQPYMNPAMFQMGFPGMNGAPMDPNQMQAMFNQAGYMPQQ